MFNRLFKKNNVSLNNLENMMVAYEFPPGLIEEILADFKKRIEKYGEQPFHIWYSNLHYSIPEEYQDANKAEHIYDTYHAWMENEVEKLESETGLPWEEQTADIQSLNEKAKKTQLVIRHRLSEIQLDLID